MRLTVNEILSTSGQNAPIGQNNDGAVLFRFLYKLWTADPRSTRDEKRREQEALHQRDRERATEEKERGDRQDTEELLTVLLVTNEIRRAIEQLQRDIDDAISAVRLRYQEACRAEESARTEFELVQRNAIVLPEGRVYFTRDGSHLYDEDGREIRDPLAIARAARLREATTSEYEQFRVARDRFDQAIQDVETQAATLERLQELRTKAQRGDLTSEDVEASRSEFQEILDTVSPETRDAYERLRAIHEGREPLAYREAAEPESSTPHMKDDFERVRSLPDVSPDEVPARPPVYRDAPEF